MVLFRLNISYIVVSALLFQQAYLERSADCSIQLNTSAGKRNVGCYWTCGNVATMTREGEECIAVKNEGYQVMNLLTNYTCNMGFCKHNKCIPSGLSLSCWRGFDSFEWR
ncbi:hypothetical protein MTO96_041720 [Rhipicephalus appendiculatus]